MTFAPRFSPDGGAVVFSLEQGGNTDIYAMDARLGRRRRRLTNAPSIDTAPSFSPDGSQIVFESDRSGNQQLYVMSAARRRGRRGSASATGAMRTPVWSPRGDLIAFTKQNAGRFHIGVMRIDGSEERLLTASLPRRGADLGAERPGASCSPAKAPGRPAARSFIRSTSRGGTCAQVPTAGSASDPSWSPLLP